MAIALRPQMCDVTSPYVYRAVCTDPKLVLLSDKMMHLLSTCLCRSCCLRRKPLRRSTWERLENTSKRKPPNLGVSLQFVSSTGFCFSHLLVLLSELLTFISFNFMFTSLIDNCFLCVDHEHAAVSHE